MKYLILILISVLPASATDNAAAGSVTEQVAFVPMEMDAGAFTNDVENTSEKIRRLLFESRRQRMIEAINSPQRDPDAAENALNTFGKENPEMEKEQPYAFSFMRGGISFWRKDFSSAYKNYDEAIRAFQKKYPNGIPGGEDYEKNASFVSQMYMGRGTSAMFIGRNEEAVADMDKGMVVAPKIYAFMHMNRCRALVGAGRYKEAAEALDRTQELDAAWLASKTDKPAICAILLRRGQHSQSCQTAN